MSIPYTARSPSPPPPLPPPRNIEELGLTHGPSPVWSWPANPNWTGFGKSHGVRSGSSLLAGTQSTEESTEDSTNPGDTARRGSSISTVTAVQRTSSSGSETMRERTGTDDGLGRIHRPSSEKRYVLLKSQPQYKRRSSLSINFRSLEGDFCAAHCTKCSRSSTRLRSLTKSLTDYIANGSWSNERSKTLHKPTIATCCRESEDQAHLAAHRSERQHLQIPRIAQLRLPEWPIAGMDP